MPNINREEEDDDIHANRNDHEVELINIVQCNLFLYVLVSIFTIT